MVDYSAAKIRLNAISEALDRRNMGELDSIVFKKSMDLYSCLFEETLYVDDTIKSKLQEVYNKLHNTTPESIRHYLSQRIATLDTAILDPGTKPEDKPALQRERDDYQNRINGINAREGNYNNLIINANKFKNDTLNNLEFNINVAIPRGAGAGTVAIDLDSKFLTTGGTTVDDYVLCDKDGNKLSSTANVSGGRDYKINIGGIEHTLVDIRIIGTVGSKQLDCSHMTITPPLSDFPKEIDLSINGVFNSITVGAGDINVVCNKKFKLKLNDGTVILNDVARLVEFNNYNDAGPGHKIENIIETNFEGMRGEIERKSLAKVLEKDGGTQYATLNDEQKEEFYQRIRNITVGGALYFDSVLANENIDTDIRRFNEFRNWFINDNRDWNKGDNIKSNHKYISFIHNNVSQKVGDFISSRLDHYLGDISQETMLKSELTNFINSIESNKLNNDNTIYDNINGYTSNNLHQMDKKSHRYEIGRASDANYMRFFSGSSTSLKGEVVNINRNTDPESIGTPGPLKYDMDVKVSGKNSIEVEIKIEGEENPIRIKSGEPAALVRKIMRDGRIRYGKARAHMGFNIYKSMVQMAKANNISLQYRNPGNNHTRYINIEDGNLIIKDVKALSGLASSRGNIIFDQKKFINSNKFDNYGDNGSLRTGIDEIGKHFTLAMNQLHNQYRHGVEKKFGTLFSSNSKMSFPTSFWTSPFKKLLNFRDSLDFDFNTTVTSKGKNISIDFKKNKFSINMEGLEKPIESKDLGKILNTRKKGIRIFDGKERDIIEGIYSNLINKLRENGKIANTNFGVMNSITGNMYVLDTDGKFGIISREDLISEGSPLKSGEYGKLDRDKLDRNTIDRFEHSSFEEKELMRNPFLMQRFVKAMNKRLRGR